MPYLHWETNRAREQMSRVIETQVETHKQKAQQLARKERKKRQSNYTASGFPVLNRKRLAHEGVKEKPTHVPARTIGETIEQMFSPKTARNRVTWENGRIIVERSPLGQFLLDAARLYEAIYLYRDQRISEEYMSGEKTLHPRRTLDQYYYGTLNTTKTRDRDQVVYRGTTRDTERAHKFRDVQPRKGLVSKIASCLQEHRGKKCSKDAPADTYRWTGHTTIEDEHGCSHCKSDVQKVSKVIMVDQLWMWVLDEKTIITSFPKRYGFNKKDPSGVHKCIRDRLRDMAADDMKSVYNLALVVLDECSYTFFDRTRTEASGQASHTHLVTRAASQPLTCHRRMNNPRLWTFLQTPSVQW